MPNYLVIAILALIAVIAFALGGFSLGRLHQWMKDTDRRIDLLEKAQAKRLPYKSEEAIEDFCGSLITTEQAFEIARLHLQRTREFGKLARNPEGIK